MALLYLSIKHGDDFAHYHLYIPDLTNFDRRIRGLTASFLVEGRVKGSFLGAQQTKRIQGVRTYWCEIYGVWPIADI